MALPTISVLGLGIIGGVWARHYQADGVLAGTWNRTPQPASPAWHDNALAAAQAAEVVQIVVADPPAVRGVLAAILPALGPGKTVVQSSTIDPAASAEFHDLVTATGAAYLEAPFTGSKPAAEQRQTVFYLGGDPAVIARLEPLLALVSVHRLPIGDHRQAAALKLAMNLNIAAQMAALGEALTLARRAGIGDDTFFGALARNVSHSGLVKLKEPKLRTADFSPQFSVKHMLKDLRLAGSTPGSEDYAMLTTVRDRLAAVAAAGHAEEDFAALMRLFR
jgi:3-hydroxyisobutyrate dehydrogenase-like beta-hydroxyacid dehydrogenase